ncbi:hypothetical protein VTI74DRAFT_7721 [Chaetomium olivicolor]
MDINRFNFWQTLPTVLEAISLSEYVAIDLEMTGISGHSATNLSQHTETTMYQLAAEAARTYQVLQLGLTCLHYDYKQKVYRTRTFTFHITPEFIPPNTTLAKLIDRKVILSYRSFLFLKENNFSFEKAFSQGVPYLSRSEGELARRAYLSDGYRQGSPADNPVLDIWSRKFQNDTRNEISTWLEANPGPLFDNDYRRRHKAILPTAFRYVIEALTGSAFADDLDSSLFLNPQPSSVTTPNHDSPPARLLLSLRLSQARLRRRRPILVGHNPLFDLCFIHEAFLGPLPADVASFRWRIHALFPRVVDTKYLASQLGVVANGTSGKRGMSLGELYNRFARGGKQGLVVPDEEEWHDMSGRGRAHDAGFDSWMTAVVFLGLVREAIGRNPGLLSCESGDKAEKGKEKGKGVDKRGKELFRELSPFPSKEEEGAGTGAAGVGLIPLWDREIWRRYGNKLRLGSRMVMNLA